MRKQILLIITIFNLSLTAQQSFDYFNINPEMGLSNRKVSFATRDANQFLWIVNSDIEYFDGHRFIRYTKSDPNHYIPLTNLNSAFTLGDTALLATNGKEMMQFSFKTRKSKMVELPFSDQLDSFSVTKMYKAPDSDYKVVFIDNSEKIKALVYNKNWDLISSFIAESNSWIHIHLTRSFALSNNGQLYVKDEENEKILVIDHDQSVSYHFPSPGETLDYHLRIVAHPRFGPLIIHSYGKIYALNNDQKFEELLEFSKRPIDIKTSHLKKDNQLLIFFQGGLYNINTVNWQYTVYSGKVFEGKSPDIYYTFDDGESITWLCTELGLIKTNLMLNPFFATTYAEKDEQNIQYREIFELGKDSIVARLADRKRHLVKFIFNENGTVDTTHLFNDVKGNSLLNRYGDYLVLTPRESKTIKYYNLNDNSLTTKRIPEETSSSFRNLSTIKEDTLHYFTAEHDIIKFNLKNSGYSKLEIKEKPPKNTYYSKFVEYLDGKYIYGGIYGLFVQNASTGELMYKVTQETFPELLSTYFNCLAIDQSIYWLGTLGGGLCKIDTDNNELKIYSTQNGLPDDFIASIEIDHDGYLWIGTYNGLVRLNPEEEQFHTFTKEDGLPDNEFNYLSSLYTESGDMYFGTFNGLVKFRPDQIFSENQLPEVIINSVSRYNRISDSSVHQLAHLKTIDKTEIYPSDNYIDLEFSVPSYIGIGNFNYEVRLSDLEEQWQNIGENASIRYQKLPAGHYDFQVRARDSKGRRSPHYTTLGIEVLQPFYKAWWFLLLVFSSATVLIYLLYRYRINLIRKESETRTRIAADLHDEIGSSMTRISMQLQLLEPSIGDPHRSTIQKLNKVVDLSINKVRDLVWSIDMSSDTWQDMIDRMEDYAYDTLAPAEIAFILNTENIAPSKELKPVVKRNLFLIFKEAINNIAKHSNGHEAQVLLRNDRGKFTMEISDNGSSEQSLNGGHGMQTMKMRAGKMHGTLEIRSGIEGFTVILTLEKSI
ncbi:sensor histidine kinase [Portibacter marinus]|uniref:sensor histidine kinase n=1 Tax=Portibacter marinus TaxID=2898660 RepID=UPI001F39B078|nr:histidine kinase [Portibacter marinus]